MGHWAKFAPKISQPTDGIRWYKITARSASHGRDRFSIINSGDEHEFAGDNPMLMLYTVNPDSTNTDGERNFDTTNELPAILFGVFLPTDDVDPEAGIEIGAGRNRNDR